MTSIRIALSVLMVATVAGGVAAQETTGTLVVRVTDAAGAPLPGASVRISRAETGFAREARSSEDGTFVAALLPPAPYDVTVTSGGIATAVREVRLHVADRLAVDVAVGAEPSERRWGSGDVAGAPATAVQYVITPRQIRTLPLIERRPEPLIAATPGTIRSTVDTRALFAAGELSFGGRAFVPQFLDGAPPIVDDSTRLVLSPSLESIEEIRVIAMSPSALWPRHAAMSFVTRSGTNTFRASAYEFRRDEALDANTFFRNLSLDPAETEEPPEVSGDIFGYSAGGAIRKDALFAFWSQEWRRRSGEAEGDFVDGRQETGRLDYRASARWQFMGRYTHDTFVAGRADRNAASVAAAQATTVLSDAAANELSYRTEDPGFGRTHGLADTLAWQRGRHALAAGALVTRGNGTGYEAWAQDSWRIHRAVTVDAGVRRRRHHSWEPGAGIAWGPATHTVLRGAFTKTHVFDARVVQWSVGAGHRLYSRGALDVAYLGRRTDRRIHSPALRYDGLLAHFRHQGTRGLLDVSYTLGRDEEQPGISWRRDDRDRRHVFTGTWSRDVAGWTIAGITTFQSGPPAPAVSIAGFREMFARQIGDPFANLPSDRYYFNPAAFAPPGPGAPGSSLSPFSLPGRNQWDVALSRGIALGGHARLGLRMDVFNLFNHTQFTWVVSQCTALPGEQDCAVANATLGQYGEASAPRQIQLGIRVDWN